MNLKKQKKVNKRIYKKIKSVFDLLFASIFLIIGSPLFFLISIFIKLSSRGPIFFLQERIGKNNKIFKCIKFRTMHPEADDILKNLLNRNDYLKKEFEENHKLKNDPRITTFGKFLRKTSLDELPQLINVIRMEMSIVGPRPIVYLEKIKYGKDFAKIISIRPGITGLWQVSGRNNLSYDRRISLDLNYVNNMHFLMDIRIIIRTIGVIIFPKDRGAY